MNRGKECEGGGGGGGGGETERQAAPPIQVPIGWQRNVDHCGVVYISPSGSVLAGLDQVRAYLLTDGTCKCGLECPLILPKVFNFDPGAAVKLRTAEDVRADEDVTKLCIHKRKLLAVATLHKSLETHPSLCLSASGGRSSAAATSHSSCQRAVRNKSKAHVNPALAHVNPGLAHVNPGLAHVNLLVPDCKNPFKMMMAAAVGQQHRHYNHHQYALDPNAASLPQQQELYPGYPRQQRLGSVEHGPRSPYRYGGLLSPPPPSSGGLGPHSPIPDSLCSPDGGYQRSSNFAGFPGAPSPSSGALHGAHRHPLSPPVAVLHGSQPPQSSCAMAGRASTPLSPTAKTPLMNMARGGHFPPGPGMEVPRVPFHHHHPHHPPPPSPCALSKKQLALEKDPLGILDPIPAKPKSLPPPSSSSSSNPALSGFHTQVPVMNVNAPPPPTIVPLPSNLPLPSAKPAPAAHGPPHGQRTPQAPSSSVPPSPVTSPVHVTSLGPGAARPEASPHRSRSSSTSSDHGSFAMPAAGGGGGMKAPPRSPRSAMGSPRPAMPSSPSVKPDALHPLSQPHAATPSPLYPAHASASSLPPQKGHPAGAAAGGGGGHPPGLLGMPLKQILHQQNAASFPASSLLSAAAKAQLANQNKHGGASNPVAAAAGGGGSGLGAGGNGGGTQPGGPPLGPRAMDAGGFNPMLPPTSSPSVLLAAPGEGQSGRAALRDKLMAQQRDPLRKRKAAAAVNNNNNNGSVAGNTLNHHHPPQPQDGGMVFNTLNHHHPPQPQDGGMVFNMLNQTGGGGGGGGGLQQPGGGPRMPAVSPAEQLRKVARLSGGGGLPSSASMASQLLQSMSGQSSHHLGGGSLRPGPGPGAVPGHYGDAPGPAAQQRLRGPGADGVHHAGGPHPHPHPQFPDMAAQVQASSLGSCAGSIGGRGGEMSMGPLPSSNPPPLSHSGPHPHHHHPQQQGLLHGLGHGTTGMVGMGHRGNTGNCGQGVSDQDKHHPQFREAPRPELHTQGEVLLPGPPQGSDRLLGGGGPEAVDAIYRAVVDAASKGKHVVITTGVSGATQASPVAALSAMSAFTNSIGESAGVNVPSAISSVAVRGHRPLPDPESLSQQQRARPRPNQNPSQSRPPGRPQSTPEPGKTNPDDPKAHHDYFRPPGRGGTRPQWEGDPAAATGFEGGGGVVGGGGAGWGVGEEFLECSTHMRSSPYLERPGALAPAPPCPSDGAHHHHHHPPTPHHHHDHHPHLQSAPLPSDKGPYLEDSNGYRFGNACGRTPANYKERLEQTVERCMNGISGGGGGGLQFGVRGYGDVLGPPRHELTGDDQSPSSSTSLEGPLLKDHGHYNGHFNGCTPSPSDTKSLSSEEDLRHPDSPSSEMLQYRARSLNVGELVWGQLRGGFPAWPGGKLNGEDHHNHHHHHHHHHHHNAGLQLRDHSKVEPEKLKTLSHDLEAFDRATKRNRKAGKLNNHLEAAIHEAMSELDKMSGSVHHQMPPRDRQVKLPKPKRRKISR
ncbi:LOW QUALITY PROTEIN: methyl-CpG-binding domain protein 5 [Aplochiton taeniatus]